MDVEKDSSPSHGVERVEFGLMNHTLHQTLVPQQDFGQTAGGTGRAAAEPPSPGQPRSRGDTAPHGVPSRSAKMTASPEELREAGPARPREGGQGSPAVLPGAGRKFLRRSSPSLPAEGGAALPRFAVALPGTSCRG